MCCHCLSCLWPLPILHRVACVLSVAHTCTTLRCQSGCLICSEKLDVEDHYVAWRQTHDQPQHQFGLDGPFSFCSYPFLLNPRAKSKLLHTEARFLMTQVSPAAASLMPCALWGFARPSGLQQQQQYILLSVGVLGNESAFASPLWNTGKPCTHGGFSCM